MPSTCRLGFAAVRLAVCAVALVVCACGGKEPTQNVAISRYSHELREAVSTNVPEGNRRDQMLQIVTELQDLQFRFSQETTDFVTSYRKLNGDYDAPRAAFEHLFADYRAKRIKARDEALDLHFRLASLATESEWDRLGKAEARMYEEVDAARPGEASNK